MFIHVLSILYIYNICLHTLHHCKNLYGTIQLNTFTYSDDLHWMGVFAVDHVFSMKGMTKDLNNNSKLAALTVIPMAFANGWIYDRLTSKKFFFLIVCDQHIRYSWYTKKLLHLQFMYIHFAWRNKKKKTLGLKRSVQPNREDCIVKWDIDTILYSKKKKKNLN